MIDTTWSSSWCFECDPTNWPKRSLNQLLASILLDNHFNHNESNRNKIAFDRPNTHSINFNGLSDNSWDWLLHSISSHLDTPSQRFVQIDDLQTLPMANAIESNLFILQPEMNDARPLTSNRAYSMCDLFNFQSIYELHGNATIACQQRSHIKMHHQQADRRTLKYRIICFKWFLLY